MVLHIVLMSLVAPAAAIALPERFVARAAGHNTLWAASAVQIALLWGIHAPTALNYTMHAPAAGFAAMALLFASAVWFWTAVLAQRGTGRWRALAALLITGKLFCLLAAILVFSPRILYPGHVVAIADQQFAGLLMIVLCPLTYVVAAISISTRWIFDMVANDGLRRPASGGNDA